MANVTGPASSTDNAITRWDGTGGTVVQDSPVIIDDSGNITGINSISSDGGTITTNGTGDMFLPSLNATAIQTTKLYAGTGGFTVTNIGEVTVRNIQGLSGEFIVTSDGGTTYPVSEAHLWPRNGKLSARGTLFSRASCPQLVPVSPVLLRQVPGGDQHSDGPGHARSPLNEPLFFQVDYHVMDRRGTDVKMPLHFVFRRGNAMHLRVLMDKRQILALLLGELGFLLPPTAL